MATFEPVDFDPFAQSDGRENTVTVRPAAQRFEPVDHDPFAQNITSDVLKSAAAGVGKGVANTVGLIPQLAKFTKDTANKYVFDPLLDATIGPPSKTISLDQQPVDVNALASPDSIQRGIETVTGKFHEPETRAGRYASSIAEMATAGLAAPGGVAMKLLSGAGAGVGAEAAEEALKGTRYAPYSRLAGALVGGLAPAALSRGVTPLPATSSRQAMVDNLASEGVTSLTAGQRTGNKSLQYLEDASSSAPMAGGGAERIRSEGQRQFSEAALRRAGAGPDASPEVLSKNRDRLGSEFERLSANNTLKPDSQFVMKIVDAVKRYRNVPDSQQKAILQGYIDDIVPHVNAGAMPGVEYQPMRSMLSADAQAVRNSDPYLSQALRGIRNALDDAMNRSINPSDRKAWQTARKQWGAQRILEKVASRAGEATAEGQVVPANLRNAVAAADNSAYSTGKGDFNQLARSGATVMAPLPNSGTAQRANAFNLLNQATFGLVPATTGRVLMSRPMQAYLANQLFAGQIAADNPQVRSLLLALTEGRRDQLGAPVQNRKD